MNKLGLPIKEARQLLQLAGFLRLDKPMNRQKASTKTQQSKTIRAAGRVISGRNAQAIQSGLEDIRNGAKTIGEVLVSAGAIDAEYVGKDKTQSVEASSFTDNIAQSDWFNRFNNILEGFLWQFRELSFSSLKSLANSYAFSNEKTISTEEERKSAIANLLNELEDLLANLSEEYPEPGNEAFGGGYYDDGPYYPMRMSAADTSRATVSESEIVAGSLTDWVNSRTWMRGLENRIHQFRHQFEHLHRTPLERLKDVESEDGRSEAIATLISELKESLQELSESIPSANSAIFASSESSSEEFVEGQTIEAASISLDSVIHVSAEISPEEARVEIQGEAGQNPNLHPIKGVLFRVDEVSESPPSVGPGLPLYVSSEVAAKALNVAQLPLEAADTLSQHDRKGTCGVLCSAEIDGKDFRVDGYVWPHNHSEKVAAILAAKQLLGMSMNARAKGHVGIQAGRKCFVVTELELLGACILFSELATWQKTNIAAQGADLTQEPVADWQPVAASSLPPTTGGDESPMTIDPVVQSHLSSLSDGMDKLGNTVSGQFDTITQLLTKMDQRVNLLESERNALVQAQADTQKRTEAQQQQQQLIEAIGSAVGQQLKEIKESLPDLVKQQVQASMNPRNVPPRLTVPIVANAGSQATLPASDSQMNIRLQIAEIDGQIKACAERDISQHIQLLDQRRDLEALLLQSAPVA